jgi:C-terminal processing protease CtpA/Prc
VAITDDAAGLRTDPASVGLVGTDVLRNFNVVFDYARERLYLRPSREFSRHFIYDATGLRLRAAPPRFSPPVVGGIVVSSPAARAGFEIGDVIVRIDGQATAKLTLEEVRGLLRLPGRQHVVTVRRNAKTIDLTLTTKELL